MLFAKCSVTHKTTVRHALQCYNRAEISHILRYDDDRPTGLQVNSREVCVSFRPCTETCQISRRRRHQQYWLRISSTALSCRQWPAVLFTFTTESRDARRRLLLRTQTSAFLRARRRYAVPESECSGLSASYGDNPLKPTVAIWLQL